MKVVGRSGIHRTIRQNKPYRAGRKETMDNSWRDDQLHNNRMNTEHQKQEFGPVTMLGLTPKKDGDQWMFLLGEDLQSGVAGFGDTPYKAMEDFNKNYGSK